MSAQNPRDLPRPVASRLGQFGVSDINNYKGFGSKMELSSCKIAHRTRFVSHRSNPRSKTLLAITPRSMICTRGSVHFSAGPV